MKKILLAVAVLANFTPAFGDNEGNDDETGGFVPPQPDEGSNGVTAPTSE